LHTTTRTAGADNDMDCVCDTAIYSGLHEEKHGVGLDEKWETVHFFLHFTDSELNAKMK
jgi:hypothetical protein